MEKERSTKTEIETKEVDFPLLRRKEKNIKREGEEDVDGRERENFAFFLENFGNKGKSLNMRKCENSITTS